MTAVRERFQQSVLRVSEGKIFLRSPYDAEFVRDVREIPSRQWVGSIKENCFDVSDVGLVKNLAREWGIPLNDDVLSLPDGPGEKLPGLSVDHDRVCLRFPYGSEIVTDIKRSVPAARWYVKERYWGTMIANLQPAIEFAQRHDLTIQPGIVEKLDEERRRADEMHAASEALDADIELSCGIPLHPYQRAAVSFLLKARNSLLGDQVGLGKTRTALAAVMEGGCLPAVVICPATLKLTWANEIHEVAPHLKVDILSGTSLQKADPEADIVIANYDICFARADDLIAVGAKSLLCDESHALKHGKMIHKCPSCKNKVKVNSVNCMNCGARNITPEEAWTVKRAAGVTRIAREIPEDGMRILISGTPITGNAVELIPQIEILGRMGEFGGPWRFAKRYGEGRHMIELNRLMRESFYCRRKKSDIWSELPSLQHAKQILDIEPEKMAVYRKASDDVVEYLANRAREIAEEEGSDGTTAYWEKRLKAEAAEHLIRVNVLRGVIAEMKIDAVTAWIKNFLDSGEKLLAFGERIVLTQGVYDRFQDKSILIRGGVSMEDRQEGVEKFQNDPETKLGVLNIKSGGTGLTLTAASYGVMMEEPWIPTEVDQCAGRFHGRADNLHGGTMYHLLVPGSVDTLVYEILEQKRVTVHGATDGEDYVKGTGVLGDLLVGLTHQGGV